MNDLCEFCDLNLLTQVGNWKLPGYRVIPPWEQEMRHFHFKRSIEVFAEVMLRPSFGSRFQAKLQRNKKISRSILLRSGDKLIVRKIVQSASGDLRAVVEPDLCKELEVEIWAAWLCPWHSSHVVKW